MSHLESVVDRLTELSGDRVSDIGESMRTGLGWVGAYKLVLLADNEKCQFHGPRWLATSIANSRLGTPSRKAPAPMESIFP